MKKEKMFIISTLIMITGFLSPIKAVTPPKSQEVNNEGRAVCSRPLSEEKISNLKKCMSKQYMQSKKKAKKAKETARKINKLKSHANCLYPYDDYYYSARKNYTSDISSYVIHDVSPTGSTIELNNGAVFTVYDKETVKNWKNTKVHITPNNRWFSFLSSNEYLLVNEQTQATAEAKLTLAPFKHSPHTRRIVQIDRDRGIVTLDNGTVWQVNNTERERRLVREWVSCNSNPGNPQEGDFIIIGQNNSTWWSNKNILINIATNSYLTFSLLN